MNMQAIVSSVSSRTRLRRSRLAGALALALGYSAAIAQPAPVPTTPPRDASAQDNASGPTAAGTEQARRDLERMREQMREMSKKMAELSARLGDVGPRAYAYRYLGDPDRAMIGVVFNDDKQRGVPGL